MISTENVTTAAKQTTGSMTGADRWDHFLARWGWKRSEHQVEPGLYSLGNPSAESPVFVTANYTLSFDALRSALSGADCYIMVLDTKGINVWCAAGKGTFSTAEVLNRIEVTGLADVVSHRRLILPQLSAPGVAGHRVEKRSGFAVEFGPIQAADLPEYLKTHSATPEMRRVRFGLRGRLPLIPVEFVYALPRMLVAAILLFFAGGLLAALAAVVALLAGAILFPILLPWLPTRDFSSKGFILGGIVALPFAVAACLGTSGPLWSGGILAAGYFLLMSPVTAYLALNFTGSTPFTSRSAVAREISTYIRPMAYAFTAGALLGVAGTVMRLVGGS